MDGATNPSTLRRRPPSTCRFSLGTGPPSADSKRWSRSSRPH